MAECNMSRVANRVMRLLQHEDVVRMVGPLDDCKLLSHMEGVISTLLPLLLYIDEIRLRLSSKYLLWPLISALEETEDLLERIICETAENPQRSLSPYLEEHRQSLKTNIALLFSHLILDIGESTTGTLPGIYHRYLKKMEERIDKAVENIKERIEDILVDSRTGTGFHKERRERKIRVLEGELAKELVSADSYFGHGIGLPTGDGDSNETAIYDFLFESSENDVEILCVVRGHGRERISAIARSVYEGDRVRAHFQPRIWVDLCEKKVKEVIVDEISKKPNDSSLACLQLRMEVLLTGKRYLVVVDNMTRQNYHSLVQVHGKSGSKVLMITDDWRFISYFNTKRQPYYYFDCASKEQTRDLFKKLAFGRRELKERHDYIARNCISLPVAPMMAIACALYFEESEKEYYVYMEELFHIKSHLRRNDLFRPRSVDPYLEVCYDRLPSNLKNCFAYCSLFSRDHEFDVQMLIRLWIAQGFIEDDDEDLGYIYFLNLLRRFFFYEAKVNPMGRVTSCLMHYAMRDISRFAAGEELSCISTTDFPQLGIFLAGDPRCVLNIRARSFLFSTRMKYNELSQDWWDQLIMKCRSLRALDMNGLAMKTAPDSIGELKHLRYLDFSHNKNLTELPNSITKLLHLQTLKLSSCFSLRKLPRDIGSLVSLRHLEIDKCYRLASLPRGFGRLTNLRTLSEVVLSNDVSEANNEANELKQLHNLQELQVKNLRHEMHDFLDGIKKLRSLSLKWGYHRPRPEDNRLRLKVDQFKLLEELTLHNCRDLNLTRFPNNLRKLSLKRCLRCPVLPALNHCVNLKMLVIDEMPELEYIMEDYYEEVSMSLQEVWLTELPRLKQWSRELRVASGQEFPSFSHLSRLVIEDCPNFSSIPLFPTLSEGLVMDSTSWEPFELTMKLRATPIPDRASWSSLSLSSTSLPLSKLKNMCIVAIESFDNYKSEQILWDTLESLRLLKFDFLPKLESLPEGLQRVKTLRELHIWRCGLKIMPVWIGKLKCLEKLVIRVCPGLESLPEEIRSLKSLKTLEIEDCLTLLRRCEKGIGADWDKIAHIREIRLGRISTT